LTVVEREDETKQDGKMEKNEIIIYNTDDGKISVALKPKDGNVWLNRQMLAELFDTFVSNISMHISNILNKDNEFDESSLVKDYFATAAAGKNYFIKIEQKIKWQYL
jgi:hypothetical protein